MHDNFYIKEKQKKTYTTKTREKTRNWRKNRKKIMQEQLQLKILKWNAIEFRDVLKTSKPRTLLFYYFMTIELNTHTLTRTRTQQTHTDKQTDRPIVEASKREEIISKQNKKKEATIQCWTAATTTSIEDSFMDFNVSFRS